MSEIKISKEINEIKEKIKSLNLGQVSELIEGLKTDYNIQETAVVQTTTTQENEKPQEKEGGNVSLKLVEIKEGSSKIKIYGIIKDKTKELKDEDITIIKAKERAEKEDKIILVDIPRDKAEEVKKQLENEGAKVEIK